MKHGEADPKSFSEELDDYFVHGHPPVAVPTILSHLTDLPAPTGSQSQVDLLNSISNFHWWDQLSKDGLKLKSKPFVNTSQHLLYHPNMEAEDSASRYKYKPCSPRHQLIMFLQSGTSLSLKRLVRHILDIDRDKASPFPQPSRSSGLHRTVVEPGDNSDQFHQLDQELALPSAPKRRRYAARVLRRLTPEQYCEQQELDLPGIVRSCQEQPLSLFSSFKQEVLTNGTVQWRQSLPLEQVILFNDYSLITGQLLPNKYVHLTVIKSADQHDSETLLRCSCQAYQQLQGTTKRGLLSQLTETEEAFLGSDLTCMHCRLFQEECMDLSDVDNLSNLQRKLTESMGPEYCELLLIDTPYPQATTKFSVKADGEPFAFVHLWFENSKCLVQCQNGMCKARHKKKRKVQKTQGKLYPIFCQAYICFALLIYMINFHFRQDC